MSHPSIYHLTFFRFVPYNIRDTIHVIKFLFAAKTYSFFSTNTIKCGLIEIRSQIRSQKAFQKGKSDAMIKKDKIRIGNGKS